MLLASNVKSRNAAQYSVIEEPNVRIHLTDVILVTKQNLRFCVTFLTQTVSFFLLTMTIGLKKNFC